MENHTKSIPGKPQDVSDQVVQSMFEQKWKKSMETHTKSILGKPHRSLRSSCSSHGIPEMEKANLECLSGNGKSNGNTKIIPGKPQDLSV